MMVVAVGITAEQVQALGGASSGLRTERMPSLLKCLVLSGDRGFRSRLEAVTELGGWESCDAPVDADEMSAAVEDGYRLVIADIANPIGGRVTDTIEAAEEFAARPGTLLVVCGSEDSIDEELWARQLGAWLYLPGVAGGDALVSLFTEARRLIERRGDRYFV